MRECGYRRPGLWWLTGRRSKGLERGYLPLLGLWNVSRGPARNFDKVIATACVQFYAHHHGRNIAEGYIMRLVLWAFGVRGAGLGRRISYFCKGEKQFFSGMGNPQCERIWSLMHFSQHLCKYGAEEDASPATQHAMGPTRWTALLNPWA
jgi:hypothetical protein